MGNRGARRAQPQPMPLPNTTYVPSPGYPPIGRRPVCPGSSPYYPRRYPGYSPYA